MNSDAENQIRIVHFSDLHLPLNRLVPPWRLLGKRVLGWANLTFNRGKTHQLRVLTQLLGGIVDEKADLVLLTGDITSLALQFEYDELSGILNESGLEPETTLVIPGNHDRYTLGADLTNSFERGMSDWLPAGFSRGDNGYPLKRELGPVVVAGLSTSIWRNPARAAGYIDDPQIHRLIEIFKDDSLAGRWPVIAMHHPPFKRSAALLHDYRTGLDGTDNLLEALGDTKATVCHGHMHLASRRQIGNLDVIGVPSASNNTANPQTQAAYNVLTFSNRGLVRAQTVRLHPNREPEHCFERIEMPKEINAD
jgi:3',5'-cyclic AMP phosphodiesterase CpdA